MLCLISHHFFFIPHQTYQVSWKCHCTKSKRGENLCYGLFFIQGNVNQQPDSILAASVLPKLSVLNQGYLGDSPFSWLTGSWEHTKRSANNPKPGSVVKLSCCFKNKQYFEHFYFFAGERVYDVGDNSIITLLNHFRQVQNKHRLHTKKYFA